MKGDFSRLTNRRAKHRHYNGVLKQQGRVQLDWEWNELISIIGQQRKMRTIDTIGQCGAPIHNSGFEILHPGNGMADLLIATGRFYAGGLLCASTPGEKLPITGFSGNDTALADDTRIEGVDLIIGQWVQVSTTENSDGVIAQITNVSDGQITVDQNLSSLHGDADPVMRLLLLFSDQPDVPNGPTYTPVDGQTDLLYLDVWERHITVIEDPDMREVALGGPDTDTRSRIIGQVKVLPDVGAAHCADEIAEWEALIKAPNGRLTTRLVDPDAPDNPCELGESGGYLGLENRLYRVEIHDNAGGNATFKWSRDNASTAYAIEQFFPENTGEVFQIRLSQVGKDDILKIKQQDWIEISGEHTDLNTDTAGTLAKVQKVDGRILTLDTDVQAHQHEPLPKIRRWDTNVQNPNDVIQTIVAGHTFALEDGIEIEFSGTEFKVGDYWVFSARTLTGDIEMLDREPPHGIQHHYCKLGLVTGLPDGNVHIEDCRPEFPPLTELDNDGGCCTITVGEGEAFTDIQSAVNALAGGPGVVCVKPEFYRIDTPIQVEGRDITIKGCEGHPVIVNIGDGGENTSVFQIRNSWEVHLKDLRCISYDGARVVEVENTSFFSYESGLLMGGGTSESGGLIHISGFGVDLRIEDNVMLGMTGIRYDVITEQQLNFHLSNHINRNIFFVLENAVLQEASALIWGIDMVDNIAMGVSLNLMSRGFFPTGLFVHMEEAGLFDVVEIERAKRAREADGQYAYTTLKADNHNTADYMYASLNAEGIFVDGMATDNLAQNSPTGKPIVELKANVVDGQILDNLLIGSVGAHIHALFESEMKSNIVITQREGVILESFEGFTLADNIMMAGKAAVNCRGALAMNLEVNNNRLTSKTRGVDFLTKGASDASQIAINIRIQNNWITADEMGIAMESSNLILFDFTMLDNSIRECTHYGILILAMDENQFVKTDPIAIQRVIQRNSIASSGAGMRLNMADVKLLDNEININAQGEMASSSYGIQLSASNGILANNTIFGYIDEANNRFSLGGIYLERGLGEAAARQQQVEIRNNQIVGGMDNGILIASDFSGLRIEENQIAGMGLNGIAVAGHVTLVSDVIISENHIQECMQRVGRDREFWTYAAILLTRAEKAQISGNVVCNNGNAVPEGIPIGGFFAEYLSQTQITDNQFINNEPTDMTKPNTQAVIHIPSTWAGIGQAFSLNVQITDNLVQSTRSPSLFFGDYFPYQVSDNIMVYFTTTGKTLIKGNQFDTAVNGPSVRIETYNGIFSSNQVNCAAADSAVLGHGSAFVANGNIATDAIIFVGGVQLIDNNLII